MKQVEADTLVWMVAGSLGAVALGVALIPLRTLTSASNFAFAFLILTIIVAEIGGRGPALVTALLSAISLNFFLTEPYLNLTIQKRDDIIAFFALVLSGLIAAAFGKKREQWYEAAKQATERMDLLSKLVSQLRNEKALPEILEGLLQQFSLGAIVLRDEKEAILAAVPADFLPMIPKTEMNAVTLFPTQERTHRYGSKGFRLPEGGGRLTFKTDRGSLVFDLWEGDPRGLNLEMRQTLAIATLILASQLSCRTTPKMQAPL